MSMDEFEEILIRETENFLDCSNKKSCYKKLDNADELVLNWRNKENTANIRFITYIVRSVSDIFDITFILDVTFDSGDSEDNHYTCFTLELPLSEEEHFQMCTTKDMLFSWEFYEYITEVLWKLRNKHVGLVERPITSDCKSDSKDAVVRIHHPTPLIKGYI